MTREYIISGAAGPIYVSEKGTRGAMLTGVYLNETVGVLVTLTGALLTFTANAVQNRLGGSLTAPVFSFTSQTLQNRLSQTLTAATLLWTSQAAQNLLSGRLTSAAFNWLAKTFQSRWDMLLTSALLNFNARDLRATGLIIILFLAMLGAGS